MSTFIALLEKNPELYETSHHINKDSIFCFKNCWNDFKDEYLYNGRRESFLEMEYVGGTALVETELWHVSQSISEGNTSRKDIRKD